MKTRHCSSPGLFVLTAATTLAAFALPAPTASAQSGDARTYSQRRQAATNTTARQTQTREPSFVQRLGNFFSGTNTSTNTATRRDTRTTTTAYARGATQYYSPAPSTTYVPTYTPTQGAPQQMTLTNRAAGNNVVIYSAPRTTPGNYNAYRGAEDPRILQPGEAATITSSGVIYRTYANGQTQYLDPQSAATAARETPVDTFNDGIDATAPVTPREQPKPVAAPKPLIDKATLPVAKWSATFGRVVSPFPPHHELDVSGLPPGSMARDPASGQIFRLP